MAEDFLNLIESLDARIASELKLFQGEGTPLSRVRKNSPEYTAKLAEATNFYGSVLNGSRPIHYFREAMTTSDFPYLFGDVIDRQLLAAYRERPASWQMWAKRSTVTDFRTVSRFRITNGDQVLDEVPQDTEYGEGKLAETRYQYAVKKYGRIIPFSFETLTNDDLGGLQDSPRRLGIAARRSEEKFATQLIADSAGPHASLYTVGQGNKISTALSVAGLQDAYAAMAAISIDANSEPIENTPAVLVVPPALEVTAKNILNATQVWLKTSGGGTSAQEVLAQNWMANLKLAVAPYLPVVITSGTLGATSWFIFADPNLGGAAVEMGFLRGHETPEIFMKSPNAVTVGGAAAGVMAGDFETDAVKYKVRHVFGGGQQDYRFTVASTGQ